MASEKVHPTDRGVSPPVAETTEASLPPPPGRPLQDLSSSPTRSSIGSGRTLLSNSLDRGQKAAPPPPPVPGTYVIQLPKEQLFKLMPPVNQKKYQSLSNNKPTRSCCRVCVCYTIALLLIFILALAIATGVIYFVFRPEAPNYSVSEIAIRGMNLTSLAPISPKFDVTVRADNKNRMIGIYYLSGSEVEVFYGGVMLSNGVLPVFYQPSKNVTVFNTALKGSNVVLANAVRAKLVNEQKKGNVPFRLNVKAPVKLKVGAVKTWEITIKVKCDISVDAVNEKSRIISRDCDYGVKLW